MVSFEGLLLCPAQVPPTSGETGHCDVVEVQEIGDTNVIVFRQGRSIHDVIYYMFNDVIPPR